MQDIIDFSGCEYSIRHGLYGGRAGSKDGILYQGDKYLVKYPKAARYFENAQGMRYTTSPLSEYIGSHIYGILGFDVHDTLLGHRNGQIVVACRDFCEKPGVQLMEMRTIKNAAYQELETKLEMEMHGSATGDHVNLNEQMLHLDYNPVLQKVDGISERFWDMAVIDVLIDNNDRDNGNWGILVNENTGEYRLAPVYDNGNAFSNKATDAMLRHYMEGDNLKERLTGSRTAYEYNGRELSAKKLLQQDLPELSEALIRNVPKIEAGMEKVRAFVQDIPETYHGHTVCSQVRKDYYVKGMEIRLSELLQPACRRALKDAELFEDNVTDNEIRHREQKNEGMYL